MQQWRLSKAKINNYIYIYISKNTKPKPSCKDLVDGVRSSWLGKAAALATSQKLLGDGSGSNNIMKWKQFRRKRKREMWKTCNGCATCSLKTISSSRNVYMAGYSVQLKEQLPFIKSSEGRPGARRHQRLLGTQQCSQLRPCSYRNLPSRRRQKK